MQTPHDAAGDLEKGLENGQGGFGTPRGAEEEEGDRSENVSPVDTVSGRTLNNLPPSPGSDGAVKFPWKQRVTSWTGSFIAQRMPSARLPNDAAPRKEPVVRCLEDFPNGYPRLGCYLDSDEQFMIYRRFGMLHSRSLLYAQDELRELEGRLMRLDRLDDRNEDDRDFLASRENDDDREPVPGRESRKELLATIKTKTMEYGQLLTQAQQLCAMNKPSWRDQRSVTNFMEAEAPVMEKDSQFIYHHEDLVTLRPGREHAWLDSAVENILIWLRCKPIEYLFVSPLTRKKTSNPRVRFYTRSRINLLVTTVITLIILALLVLPIFILFQITIKQGRSAGSPDCIGVLVVFTLLFSAVLSMFTKAKRHEILAAAAAYCAVLVVFVGNVS